MITLIQTLSRSHKWNLRLKQLPSEWMNGLNHAYHRQKSLGAHAAWTEWLRATGLNCSSSRAFPVPFGLLSAAQTAFKTLVCVFSSQHRRKSGSNEAKGVPPNHQPLLVPTGTSTPPTASAGVKGIGQVCDWRKQEIRVQPTRCRKASFRSLRRHSWTTFPKNKNRDEVRFLSSFYIANKVLFLTRIVQVLSINKLKPGGTRTFIFKGFCDTRGRVLMTLHRWIRRAGSV